MTFSRKSQQMKKTNSSDYEQQQSCRFPRVYFMLTLQRRGGYKRGKNTCAGTWRYKRGGAYFRKNVVLKELCQDISVFLVTEAGCGSPIFNQVRGRCSFVT